VSVLADDLMRMGDLVHSATVDDLGGIQLYRFTADPCTYGCVFINVCFMTILCVSSAAGQRQPVCAQLCVLGLRPRRRAEHDGCDPRCGAVGVYFFVINPLLIALVYV
jgi:hypothetical protein